MIEPALFDCWLQVGYDNWPRGGALFDVTKSDMLENNQYQVWKR